jgi:hypothetical protein
MVAQNMKFRLNDGYIDAQELTDHFESKSQKTCFDISTQLFLEGIEPLRRLESMIKNSPKERFNDLWGTVMWRSTSKLKDEAICLATIMGLSTEDIVGAADEEKLKKFIILQQRFRADFIFRLGPRMKQDGYGCAPLTFVMNFFPALKLTSSPAPLAFADESGLHVKYPGLLFRIQNISVVGNQLLFVDEKNGNRYFHMMTLVRHW